jgi:hypothetical protein
VSHTRRARLRPFIALNLGVRFLVEIWMLTALAWAGAEVGSHVSWLVSVALAIAFVLPAAVVWGVWIAPKAKWRLADPARLLVELVLFAAATDALAYAANLALAAVFAVLVVANTAVLRLSHTEH